MKSSIITLSAIETNSGCLIRTVLPIITFLPNFFCFGQFEIDEYKKFKVEVKNFFKVGSVRLANFFYYIKKKKIKLKNSAYDICYSGEDVFFNISDWLGVKNAERDQIKIAKYLIKFCIKHNMKLITTIKYIPKTINDFNLYKDYLTSDELNYLWNSLYKSKILYKRYTTVGKWKRDVRIIFSLFYFSAILEK